MTQFDLPAADHMVAPAHTVRDTTRLAVAAQSLNDLGLSALPVLDGARRLTGLLDRAALVRVGRLRGSRAEPRWWLPDMTVAECMQSAVPVVSRTTPLRECARRMLERGEHRLFVVVDRELQGVIGPTEILRAVASAQSSTTIGAISYGRAMTIAATGPLSLAIERLAASAGRPLVVLDGDVPTGIFSRRELSVCLEADTGQATGLWLDGHVLALPASTPAHRAAEQAIDAHARYVIAIHDAAGYSVVSSLAFASIVAGLPPAEADKHAGTTAGPNVSIAVPDYPRDPIENARAAAITDPAPATHTERDAPSRIAAPAHPEALDQDEADSATRTTSIDSVTSGPNRAS